MNWAEEPLKAVPLSCFPGDVHIGLAHAGAFVLQSFDVKFEMLKALTEKPSCLQNMVRERFCWSSRFSTFLMLSLFSIAPYVVVTPNLKIILTKFALHHNVNT